MNEKKKHKKDYIDEIVNLVGFEDIKSVDYALKKFKLSALIELSHALKRTIQPIKIEHFKDIVDLNTEKHHLCLKCDFNKKTPVSYCRAYSKIVSFDKGFPVFELIEDKEGGWRESSELSFSWGKYRDKYGETIVIECNKFAQKNEAK